MPKSKRNSSYLWILVPVIAFIIFGAFKMESLSHSNHTIEQAIQRNQATIRSLKKQQGSNNLTDYEKSISKQGANLYQEFPQVDQSINKVIHATYGNVRTQSDYDRAQPKVAQMIKGTYAKDVLEHIKPQEVQGSNKPVSPYGSVKDIQVSNQFGDYIQGNIIVLTDVSYTTPSQKVTAGRTFTIPGEKVHDYYVSSYNTSTHQLNNLDSNHSQKIQKEDDQ